MKISLIIPVYNESQYLNEVLTSIVEQSLLPNKIIIVNDNSTDNTQQIIDLFTSKYPFITSIYNTSTPSHQPGSKVVKAFNLGYIQLKDNFDIIGKFDGDIILPKDYFKRISDIFYEHKNVGISGGNLYIKKNEKWIYENIAEKTKVRGPIKLYRKQCFQDIGGLKESMGWDTVDELLAQYHGWEVKTDPSLHVKHLKPTGATYTKSSKYKQGEAFKKMRYGFLLTLIASAKLALKKRSFTFFYNTIKGFLKAKNEFIVTKEEGIFIRNLRWRNIKKKLF